MISIKIILHKKSIGQYYYKNYLVKTI